MDSTVFGRLPDGTQVHAFTLRGESGLTAIVTEYGGRLCRLDAPTPAGPRNVTLGFDSLAPYLSDGAHLGALTGRYANRIAGGRFTLDGRAYELPRNNGGNTLHGGPDGFACRVWRGEPDGSALRLSLHSPDGDQGFPGALDVTVHYRIVGSALEIDYAATCDAPTVLNLTHHAYFNLAGADLASIGTVMEHVLHIPSSRITPLDASLMPTGEIRDIAGTALDFRTPTAIGARIDAPDGQLRGGGGYDLCYVLADAPRAVPQPAATVTAGGLRLEVLTTEPGLQVYTGNFLNGNPFPWRSGLCLETQHFADSPNQPGFPSTVLRPGDVFRSRTLFRFSFD